MPYHWPGMKRALVLRPYVRRRLAWLVVVMLLWQQVAVAAYACTTVPASSTSAVLVTSSSMRTMGGDCAHAQATSTDPTCQQHCQPEQTIQAEARTGSVPPNALSAMAPMLLSMTTVALPTRGALLHFDRQHAPPPEPRWLFCTLLI